MGRGPDDLLREGGPNALNRAIHDQSAWLDVAKKPAPRASVPRSLRSRIVADIQPEEIMWLWGRRIPMGMVTIVDGPPGVGKSTIALDIAARVSTGRPMPGEQDVHKEPGRVIIWAPEDPAAQVIRPRLDAAGADLAAIRLIDELITLPDDTEALAEMVRADSPRLLIIEPLTGALSGQVDSHRDQDVRRALMPLQEMAEHTGCAVLTIRHHRKGAGPAIDRGLGSVAIGALARSVLTVGIDPTDDGRRIIAPAKGNLSLPPPSLVYRLEPIGSVARVVWQGESAVSADELTMHGPKARGERNRLKTAMDTLTDLLANGPVPATDAEERARVVLGDRCGPTLRRARKQLGVVIQRQGFGPGSHVMWSLPSQGLGKQDE